MSTHAVAELNSYVPKNVEQLQLNDATIAILSDVGRSKAIFLAIDPATAAILWEIGKKLLIDLGVKALSGWFNLENNKGVQEALRALLLDIADIIRRSLDEEAVRQATSSLEGLTILLREYDRAPETSRFRLEAAIVKSADVVKQLEDRLPISANAYILSCYARIAALQELTALSTGKAQEGERLNYITFARECAPKVKGALEALMEQNRARVTDLQVIARTEGRVDPIIAADGGSSTDSRENPITRYSVVEVKYFVDGTMRRFYAEDSGISLDDLKARQVALAVAARNQDAERIEVEFMSKVGLPMGETVSHIVEIGNRVTPVSEA